MKTFNVTAIPSMVVDGILSFESVVPTQKQLESAILKALEVKNDG